MSQEIQAIIDLKAIRAALVERRRTLAGRIASTLTGPLSGEGIAFVKELTAMQASFEALDRMIAEEVANAPGEGSQDQPYTPRREPRKDMA